MGERFKNAKAERAAATPVTKHRSIWNIIPGTRVDDFLGPWVAILFLFGLAMFIRTVDGGIQSTVFRVLQFLPTMGVATVVVIALRRYTESRHPFLQLHGMVSTYAYALILSVTVLVGVTRWWIWTLIYGGSALALSWNVREINAFRSRGTDNHDAGWNEQVGIDEGNLNKIRTAVRDASRKGLDSVKIGVTVHGGRGFEHIAKAVPGINNALGLPKGAVRAIERADKGSNQADMHIVLSNPLRGDIPFPETVEPKSIHDGLELGRYEDNTLFRLLITGGIGMEGPTAPSQTSVMGMTRAGKSHLFRIFVWQLSFCTDVVLWVIDVAKANQTVRPLLPAIDRLTVTPDSAGEALDDVRRILIERGNWMAEHGLDEWEPGCGIPAHVVWVEEGSALLGGMAVWKQLAQASLSLGVFLFDSMQRASAKDKDTGARAQIGNVLCFGVKSKADARFVLDDAQLIDRVSSWRNRRQGSFVADVVGVDDLHRSMSVRTFWSGGRDETIGRIERDIRTNSSSMARPDETIVRGSRPYSRPSTVDDPRTIPGRALDRPSSIVHLEPVDASSSVRRMAFGRAVEEAARPDPERGGQIIVRPRDVLRVMDDENDWFDPTRHRPWVMGELKGACERGILRRVDQGVYAVTGSDGIVN